MTDVVSVGDLQTAPAMVRRAEWMRRHDVGERPAPHPRPVVPGRLLTATDNYPARAPMLAELARDAGWYAFIIYSAGTVMHANGKPGRLVEVVSVRCWRFPNDRAALTWQRPLPRGKWTAGDGWVWQVGQIPVNYGVEQATGWVTKGTTPVRTEDKPAGDKGACQVCAGLFKIRADGKIGVHGPKTDRCHGGNRVPVAK